MGTSYNCDFYFVALDTFKASGPVLAAVAAACIASIAWLAKSLVELLAWNYTECQKRIELMTAIKSEIISNGSGEKFYADTDQCNGILSKFDDSIAIGTKYIPYTVTTSGPPPMNQLMENFLLLRPSVSKRAFRYANLSAALSATIEDWRSKPFSRLAQERQRQFIIKTFDLGKLTSQAGDDAVGAIRKSIRRHKTWQILPTVMAAGMVALATLIVIKGPPKWIRPAEKQVARWVGACGTSSAKPSNSTRTGP